MYMAQISRCMMILIRDGGRLLQYLYHSQDLNMATVNNNVLVIIGGCTRGKSLAKSPI